MEPAAEKITEIISAIPDQILEIVETELTPLISLGVSSGFVIGTLVTLTAYGAFKAISLLSIKNISR